MMRSAETPPMMTLSTGLPPLAKRTITKLTITAPKTISDSGRIQRARSLLRKNPAAPMPTTISAVAPAGWVTTVGSFFDEVGEHRPQPDANGQRGAEQPAHGERTDPEALAAERRDEQHPEADDEITRAVP